MTPGYALAQVEELFPDKDLYNNGCSFPCSECMKDIVFNEPSLNDVSLRVLCPHCDEESEHVRVYQLKLQLRTFYNQPKRQP